MNMVEEQDHPMNHQWGEEDMNMMDSHMMEVKDMNTLEEHYHPMNHQPEVEDMDTVKEHYHPMNHRSEVNGMDREDSGMGRIWLLRWMWLKESPMTWCWRGIGLARHWRAHQEWEELVKSRCSEGQPM
jgi:hypothetical protein